MDRCGHCIRSRCGAVSIRRATSESRVAVGQRRAAGARWRMTAPALELKGVQKSFGRTPIINGVDLAIAQGERHAIIGPNGAGKSTLFNLISGRFHATSGQILLKGEDISGLEAQEINR